jgi:hypothetical protein
MSETKQESPDAGVESIRQQLQQLSVSIDAPSAPLINFSSHPVDVQLAELQQHMKQRIASLEAKCKQYETEKKKMTETIHVQNKTIEQQKETIAQYRVLERRWNEERQLAELASQPDESGYYMQNGHLFYRLNERRILW